MKKIISLFVLAVAFSSCQEEVKFNTPGFQAYRDNVLFRAIDMRAYQSTSGAISLEGLAQGEELVLSLPSSNVGTYYLGTTNQNISAEYTSNFNDIDLYYATNIISGSVAQIEMPLVSGGSGYTASSGVATTGGSGTGLTVRTIVNSAGVVTDVKLSSPGNNYLPGDLITISGGDANARFRVLNIEGSNGEIVIESVENGTISGKFKFNAVNVDNNPLGGAVVNFQYGEFYKVPIVPQP